MKTNELKSLLGKMNYSVKHINEIIVIKNEYGNVIATIEKDITFKFSTQYYAWNFISYSEQKIILSYIMGYAATPVDKREEEKKFYLRHRWLRNGGFYMYVKHHTKPYGEVYELVSWRYGEINDMQFTLKEIEKIKEKFNTDLGDFEKTEVEDENKNKL